MTTTTFDMDKSISNLKLFKKQDSMVVFFIYTYDRYL